MYAQLNYQLLDGDFVLAETSVEDSGMLTVEQSGIDATFSLDASGSFEVQENSSDPTPTP